MKGERLGEFEELLLLAAPAVPDEECSVVEIQRYLERVTERRISLGAVYAGLDRLELKGCVRSTRERGGRRKRIFTGTGDGRRLARDARRVRDAIWRTIEGR